MKYLLMHMAIEILYPAGKGVRFVALKLMELAHHIFFIADRYAFIIIGEATRRGWRMELHQDQKEDKNGAD